MNDDQLVAVIRQLGDEGDVPVFDPRHLAQLSHARTRRARVAAAAGAVAVLVGAGVTVGALYATSSSRPQAAATPTQSTRTQHPAGTSDDGDMAPACPLLAHPIIVGQSTPGPDEIIARTTSGTPVTISARLSFQRGAGRPVTTARLIIARPGTRPGVPLNPNAQLATGPPITATSPTEETLTVIAGARLNPGIYPVFMLVRYSHALCRGAPVPPTQQMSQPGVLKVR